ncbi:hypothetical protein ME763_35785 [Streptomyces murinus]|uniref:hypothetical protein n=1 Tax=Streptomyces murinus TaxID=33900 RepID=UPI000A1E8AF9|nr:hypothetical protein [Streptomyces murinus]WDO10577.1 hypothetical protein ME763_35785 [Streptomyces murinus]
MADIPMSPRSTGTTRGRPLPPPALGGFLLLLMLLFAVSYAVGSAAGPVAPGLHGTGSGGNGGSGGGDDDMPGMSHGSGE